MCVIITWTIWARTHTHTHAYAHIQIHMHTGTYAIFGTEMHSPQNSKCVEKRKNKIMTKYNVYTDIKIGFFLCLRSIVYMVYFVSSTYIWLTMQQWMKWAKFYLHLIVNICQVNNCPFVFYFQFFLIIWLNMNMISSWIIVFVFYFCVMQKIWKKYKYRRSWCNLHEKSNRNICLEVLIRIFFYFSI